MHRRTIFRLCGLSGAAACGAGGLFAATRTPADALAPWSTALAQRYQDPRMNALAYAVLAPNPHNRQPWLIELIGEDQLLVRFDQDKQLPHTDPFDRQLTIGLGCFIELFKMAANARGYAVDMSLFPQGSDSEQLDDRPVARLRLKADASISADPLWPYVARRRSCKEPYDLTRSVPEAALQRILSAAKAGTTIRGSVESRSIEAMRKLTEQALRAEVMTPRTYKESVDLFRIGKTEVNRNPDGIDFSGVSFEALSLLGLFSREAALDRASDAFERGLLAVLENCRTAMGHVWLLSNTNSREDQIAAGADWLRVNLAIAKEGLSCQPLSQALQEYPEVRSYYDALHLELAKTGGTVQMLARIGYGPDAAESPRWPIEAKLVTN